MLKFKNLKQRSINTNNFGSNKDHTKTLKISYSEQNFKNISNKHSANPTTSENTKRQQPQANNHKHGLSRTNIPENHTTKHINIKWPEPTFTATIKPKREEEI